MFSPLLTCTEVRTVGCCYRASHYPEQKEISASGERSLCHYQMRFSLQYLFEYLPHLLETSFPLGRASQCIVEATSHFPSFQRGKEQLNDTGGPCQMRNQKIQ